MFPPNDKMVNPENVFDFYDIFVNEVIGDLWLTIIITFIIVNVFAIKKKVPFEVITMFDLLILAAFFSRVTSLTIIWVFIVLFVGVQFYLTLAKKLEGR